MPIPNPILDDRSYQQLRDELIRRIPVYNPEWTDHNASDPGITLLELSAFLGENLLYRFNQIPEKARLEFLRLLQIPLRSAEPSGTLVSFVTAKADGELVEVESELKAGSVAFSAEVETHAWPLAIEAFGRVRASPPNPATEPEVAQFADNAMKAVGALPAGYRASFYKNEPVSLDAPPVDFNATVDATLWISVLKEKSFDPGKFKGTTGHGPILNIGFVREPVFGRIQDVKPCEGELSEQDQTGVDYSARAGNLAAKPDLEKGAVEWQVSTTSPQPTYLPLKLAGDTTLALSQDGIVRLEFPADPKQYGNFLIADPNLRGTGEFPPALDEEKEKRLLCWIRAFRRDGLPFGKVQLVAGNATRAVQTRRAQVEFLGTGTAQPAQTYTLQHPQAIRGTVRVQVEDGARWTDWKEVDSFRGADPDDRLFTLDPEAGKITFGNGEQGLAPQIGQRIRVNGYRYGGGAAGNVAAKAISKAPGQPALKVSNPMRARGGADAESIREGLARIPEELRRRDRAVTAGDFQELAFQTPGAEVGRAECLPRFHPPSRLQNAAGVVTVVVWPREDPAHPSAPVPDRTLLRSVCQWLDRRRLVTTELYVIPPTYHKVAVSIGLEVKPGYGVEAVRRWVELVVRQYLAPLPPYGPEGGGWPLGKQVYGPEIEAAALQVEGVRFLRGANVAHWTGTEWKNETVILQAWEVPELAEISIVPGEPSTEPWKPVASPIKVVPVPIPVVRETC